MIELPIKGKRYEYTIVLDTRAGYFEIIALQKQAQRKSSITNHNRILSDICSGIIDTVAVEETYIDGLTCKQVHLLYDRAIEHFGDEDWVANCLEPALDEDRVEGEWSKNR